jgi:hypothetical protein
MLQMLRVMQVMQVLQLMRVMRVIRLMRVMRVMRAMRVMRVTRVIRLMRVVRVVRVIQREYSLSTSTSDGALGQVRVWNAADDEDLESGQCQTTMKNCYILGNSHAFLPFFDN